jgi:hypothetical protein
MAAERRRLRPLIENATVAWCRYRGTDPQVHEALGATLARLRNEYRWPHGLISFASLIR